MSIFNKYPYTDFHEINLDWVLSEIKKLEYELTNFVKLNTIKYANPILWDITKQYEANTVVIDGHTGNAYLSTNPVPVGVDIVNTEYWTGIFNYESRINEVISMINEEATTRELADVALTDKINEEATTRELSDVELNGRVNNIQTTIDSLKYYVTPEDFGALGGDNDDTEAVQQAINDGRPVLFTQDYNITSILIPHDTSRIISIDFDKFWLHYIGNGTEIAAITMKGISCELKNVKLNNKTDKPIVGIYWTSDNNTSFSAFNIIRGCRVNNFNTGIFYGDYSGSIDAPQSENTLTGFYTRGCNIPFYSKMDNAIINISDSVIMSSKNECLYQFDDARAACIRCDGGLVMVTNSEVIKPGITTGYGLFGKNINISDSVIEIASPWAYCAGDITLCNTTGGFYSQAFVTPFIVDPNAAGILTLDNVIIKTPALTDAKLIQAVTGYYGSDAYSVILNKVVLNDRQYSTQEPITDYPIMMHNCIINGKIIDAIHKVYDAGNYTEIDLYQASAEVINSNIKVSSIGPNPGIATPEYHINRLLSVTIDVKEMVGSWSIGFNLKAADDTPTYPRVPLHAGINNVVILGGSLGQYFKSAVFSLQGSSANDNITFSSIDINA